MAAPSINGWLDIHGHFQLPQTIEEARQRIPFFLKANFLVQEPVIWNVEDVLKYNDLAEIRMQMLSCIPGAQDELRRSNDFGASLVMQHPGRFGLLAALPTEDPAACLQEISRTEKFTVQPDGFAVTTVRNGCYLGDPRLDPVWTELNSRKAVVHIHPNASFLPQMVQPTPLVEVAFDTARTVVNMLYNGVLRRFTDIKFVLAHCGGALPVLFGRLKLLGTESWVPNPNNITREEIVEQLGRLYIDTAATAETGLGPAIKMAGINHCIYGSDCGVPCSTNLTMEENRNAVIEIEKEYNIPINSIGKHGWDLFPLARQRALHHSVLNEIQK